jgi:hypothetical protein
MVHHIPLLPFHFLDLNLKLQIFLVFFIYSKFSLCYKESFFPAIRLALRLITECDLKFTDLSAKFSPDSFAISSFNNNYHKSSPKCKYRGIMQAVHSYWLVANWHIAHYLYNIKIRFPSVGGILLNVQYWVLFLPKPIHFSLVWIVVN